jgi:hypothetical protein
MCNRIFQIALLDMNGDIIEGAGRITVGGHAEPESVLPDTDNPIGGIAILEDNAIVRTIECG